jgi:hypothetical protein
MLLSVPEIVGAVSFDFDMTAKKLARLGENTFAVSV